MRDERILVAWVEREGTEIKWCKARYKETTRYQDSVPTACGHVITLPAGLAYPDTEDISCPDCLKKFVREDGVPDRVFLVDNPSGPSMPTKWHRYQDCGVLAGVCFGSTRAHEASKILGTKLNNQNLCGTCRKRALKETRNETTRT
jgi:hypothetical protein